MADELESDDFYHRGIIAGTMYRYSNGVKIEIYACEEPIRLRLTVVGFVEDPQMPNTYWYAYNKEALNG